MKGRESHIICFTCKEKGHISSNCPKKGITTNGGGKGGGGKGGGKDKNQVTSPYKMKPKDGESLSRPSMVRNVLGVTSADNGRVQINGIPLKNTRQEVNFKVELQLHQ